jgi:phage FluMu protein Com
MQQVWSQHRCRHCQLVLKDVNGLRYVEVDDPKT